MTDKRKLIRDETIASFDPETRARGFAVLDQMADIGRMLATMNGMPLRAFLETQHDNPDLIDMIIERAALLPPLDEPPKQPTADELREAGKAGKLRVVVETPDAETMDAVKQHADILGIAFSPRT